MFCAITGCTNKVIAAECGISDSALSRYRSGNRTPELDSDVVHRLAAGLARLGEQRDCGEFMEEKNVLHALNGTLVDPALAGERICSRFRALADLLGIRNSEVARTFDVDPSYISRIRAGQRFPGDRVTFAEAVAEIAAQKYYRAGRPEGLAALLSSNDMLPLPELPSSGDSPILVDLIVNWMLGQGASAGDVAEIEHFFSVLEGFDLEQYIQAMGVDEHVPPPREPGVQAGHFYYGSLGVRFAELEFMRIANMSDKTKKVVLQTDMPVALKYSDSGFVRAYTSGLYALIKRGVRLVVIHDVAQSYTDMIASMLNWAPAYMTGMVEPRYVFGVHNRVFCRQNVVSEACALSGEAIVDHESDGRYYLTTKPEEVEYYRRKMSYLLEHTAPLMDVYRSDNPARLRKFEVDEAKRKASGKGRRIAEGRFQGLEITWYDPNCVVVSKLDGPVIHFVVRHPKVCYAITCLDRVDMRA